MERLRDTWSFSHAQNSLRSIIRQRESPSHTQPASVYQNISNKNNFSKSDLESCSDGLLFGEGNAQLPTPPLLMLDRVTDIQSSGGKYERGYAVAELDIAPNKWFFKHHFRGDPVMPGCLLIEAFWQLTGFHMAWSGFKGKGRVLESGRTRFLEPVSQETQTLTITVSVRKIISKDNPIYISDGEVHSNDSMKCKSDAIKVGLFAKTI